jgi:hypothetical protein
MHKTPDQRIDLGRSCCVGFLLCAAAGIRTPNLLIRSQMLYPLSYSRSFFEATSGTPIY